MSHASRPGSRLAKNAPQLVRGGLVKAGLLAFAGAIVSASLALPASAVETAPEPVILSAEEIQHAETGIAERAKASRAARLKRIRANRARLARLAAKREVAENNKILALAASRYGTPYVYGGAGTGGFDCSGFTAWVYRAMGVYLPHSSDAQVAHTRITRSPEPGDLVFFHNGGDVYHVGIYAGGWSVWHSPRSGSYVKKERIWTSSVFFGEVRALA
jgi:cell wall-associated NlpC family hydrolase